MVNSILLVRLSSIGDVVQTFPVAEYLRAKFPKARIDWVVEASIAPLIRQLRSQTDQPLIDTVIEIDTKRWVKSIWLQSGRSKIQGFITKLQSDEYDVVFDLQGNCKSGFVTMLSKAKEKVGYGKHSVRERPNLLATTKRFDFPLDLNIREKYLKLAKSYFNDPSDFTSQGLKFELSSMECIRFDAILQEPLMQRPFKLMIAASSKWKNKTIGNEALVCLLKTAAEKQASFLFIYASAEEKKEAEKLQRLFPQVSMVLGDLTLPLWQTLMHHVNGIIAMDSAALHFAGTTKTPSFSFFGPTSAKIFKPLEEQHHAYQSSCPYAKTFLKQCPILRSCKTGACLQQLDYAMFKDDFENWLNTLSVELIV